MSTDKKTAPWATPTFTPSDMNNLLGLVDHEKTIVGALIAGAIALLPDKDEDGDPLNTEALALLKHCQQQVWNVSLYQLFAREVEKASGGVKLSVDW